MKEHPDVPNIGTQRLIDTLRALVAQVSALIFFFDQYVVCDFDFRTKTTKNKKPGPNEQHDPKEFLFAFDHCFVVKGA